ncbi:MAG: FKBP-type peptidyl-prolyl cis-trans isomerase, partial [Oscillospiraceae bacterium]|nr:FKBP-type peptidyl-prolyl cis-trans isomerase [Oscillospiraceae bacterium]
MKFDSSYDRGEPLEFICGAGMMIPGFDTAVANMDVGETVNVHLQPSEAYGERNPEVPVIHFYRVPQTQFHVSVSSGAVPAAAVIRRGPASCCAGKHKAVPRRSFFLLRAPVLLRVLRDALVPFLQFRVEGRFRLVAEGQQQVCPEGEAPGRGAQVAEAEEIGTEAL